jgi:hypothetical protein
MNKVEQTNIRYFDLFQLLKGLESERPGIKNRVWNFLKDNNDIQFSPINYRILGMNLFYYGVGDEYPIKNVTIDEVNHSKKIHPEAFINGTPENELRKDLNFIWYIYDVEDEEIECFNIMPKF